MKTKVYYCYTKDGRGYWKLWSNQDECNYLYSTKVAPARHRGKCDRVVLERVEEERVTQ